MCLLATDVLLVLLITVDCKARNGDGEILHHSIIFF